AVAVENRRQQAADAGLRVALGFLAEHAAQAGRGHALLLVHAAEHAEHQRREHGEQLARAAGAETAGLAESARGLVAASAEDVTEDRFARAGIAAEHAAEQAAEIDARVILRECRVQGVRTLRAGGVAREAAEQ